MADQNPARYLTPAERHAVFRALFDNRSDGPTRIVSRHPQFGRAIDRRGKGIVHVVERAAATFPPIGPVVLSARFNCGASPIGVDLGDDASLGSRRCHRCDFDGTFAPTGERFVYYAQAEDALIKIGISANVPQRAYALKARVLAVEPGTYMVEKARHKAFDADRVRGEWFRPSEQLMAHIAALAPAAEAVA